MNLRVFFWLSIGIGSAAGFGVVAWDLAKTRERANDFAAKWESVAGNMTFSEVEKRLGPRDANEWDLINPSTWHYLRPNRRGEIVHYMVFFFGGRVIEKQSVARPPQQR